MEILEKWLFENIPMDIPQSKIVHGDWRIDNLIFSREDFSLLAIVDWELSTIGDPRADLATQIMQWMMPVGHEVRGLGTLDRKKLGIPSDQQYIEMYSERTGLDNEPDLTFAIAFAFYRMGAILQGVKKRAQDGNASNPQKALKMGSLVSIFAQRALSYLKI